MYKSDYWRVNKKKKIKQWVSVMQMRMVRWMWEVTRDDKDKKLMRKKIL